MSKKKIIFIVFTTLFFLIGCNRKSLIDEHEELSLLETSFYLNFLQENILLNCFKMGMFILRY